MSEMLRAIKYDAYYGAVGASHRCSTAAGGPDSVPRALLVENACKVYGI